MGHKRRGRMVYGKNLVVDVLPILTPISFWSLEPLRFFFFEFGAEFRWNAGFAVLAVYGVSLVVHLCLSLFRFVLVFGDV